MQPLASLAAEVKLRFAKPLYPAGTPFDSWGSKHPPTRTPRHPAGLGGILLAAVLSVGTLRRPTLLVCPLRCCFRPASSPLSTEIPAVQHRTGGNLCPAAIT